MISIILNNSNSRIINAQPWFLKKTRSSICYFNLSVWIRTKNRFKATKYLIDEDGHFPTGLLKRIEKFFILHNQNYHIVDNRISPKHKSLNLRDLLQEPPLYIEQDLAASAVVNNISGILEMPTGIGKTRTIKEAILRTQRPTLVITPSSNLRTQTYQYLADSFGTDNVGLLKVSHDKPIIITNYHSISSKSSDYYKQFSQLMFDEFHNAAAEGVREDFIKYLDKIYYRYGFTATNFKNDENSNIYLESVLSDTLFSVTTQEAISKGYIRPLVPFFYDLKNDQITPTHDYRVGVKTFIDENQERNGITIEGAKKMIQSNIPTLILVDHVGHGRFLKESLGKDAIFLNGQDESSSHNIEMVKKFNNLEIPCLIGTSVLGEGVDTKAAGAVYNLSGGKARSELMQKCGRVVRNFKNKKVGYYFDFIDNKQSHLFKHSMVRKDFIEEIYGTKVNIIQAN